VAKAAIGNQIPTIQITIRHKDVRAKLNAEHELPVEAFAFNNGEPKVPSSDGTFPCVRPNRSYFSRLGVGVHIENCSRTISTGKPVSSAVTSAESPALK
jgi:hypothetical protein